LNIMKAKYERRKKKDFWVLDQLSVEIGGV
jgi:hypothetical protein